MCICGHQRRVQIHLITSAFWFSLTTASNGIKRVLFHLELLLSAPCCVIHIEGTLVRVWLNEKRGRRVDGGLIAEMNAVLPLCLSPNEILPSFRRRANQCPYQLSHQDDRANQPLAFHRVTHNLGNQGEINIQETRASFWKNIEENG